jgi:hypothetical protein
MRSIVPALAVCLLAVAPPADAQTLTREQQAEFLRTARIVEAVPIGKGVTKPMRLTLTDGTLTHDAAFQSVDDRRSVSMRTGRGGKPELNFTDSWRFNVAAPRVAELLGIGEMVPVSVERAWNGRTGALTWWVDEVLMDDEERRKTNAQPPDIDAWFHEQNRMRLFTELAYDTDRNQGNILITRDWKLVMIDFTRAFRQWSETPNPLTVLRRIDRRVLAAMRGLTKADVQKAAGKHLTPGEVDGLLARRDIIVRHFDALVAKSGEDKVLY